jgi:hypothetical protein
MIVQPTVIISKQQNQPHRECLYAWYPEATSDTVTTTSIEPRDIYIHNGIDRDLLEQKPSSANECKKSKVGENRHSKKNKRKNQFSLLLFFLTFNTFFYFFHLIVVVTSACINSNTSVELLQRYKQSIAPSDRAYHSTETIDEALSPPWALHYEIKRRPVTPNPTDSTSK